MDSNRIKNLAFGARVALRDEVQGRLTSILAEDSPERLEQRDKVATIERAIREHGEDAVVETAAYTWFNRLCALRYMDVKGYTPVGVVTPKAGATQPAILADAMQGVYDPEFEFRRDLKDKVSALLAGAVPSANPTEAAYSELLAAVCDYYSKPISYLFKEDVASSLLMPQGLLAEGSILRRIIEDMNAETCESVEVLGWLYQYYIAERKDEIFASNKKRGAKDIAPATQLFTPKWIVQYMVENSLGRIWMQNFPDSALKAQMPYYIEGEDQGDFLKIYSAEDLTLLDPACGSGHILVYAFDLLYQMYEEEGWLPEDIPALILQKNLQGFEIDTRAAEIAMFALEMKAREMDPRFFERSIDARVKVLKPVRFADEELEDAGIIAENTELRGAFEHLDEIGSLYVPQGSDLIVIDNAIKNLEPKQGTFADITTEKLKAMRETVEALSQKFSCVVANPPYMASSAMENWAKDWIKNHYPDEKADLFSAFIVRNLEFAEDKANLGFMTPYVWMFISSYEKLRERLINTTEITSLVQLEYSGFAGATVPICTFTLCKDSDKQFNGFYIRLSDFVGAANQAPKTLEAIQNPDCGWLYKANQQDFKSIPGSPIAYWVSRNVLNAFAKGVECNSLSDFCKVAQGITTGDNARFLRFWWEVDNNRSIYNNSEKTLDTHAKWFACDKGGDYRKWYGNNVYVINWLNNGEEIIHYSGSTTRNLQASFKQSSACSKISSSDISFRHHDRGFIFSDASVSVTDPIIDNRLIESFLNSSVARYMLQAIAPTLNYEVGQIRSLPILLQEINPKVIESTEKCRQISREDWNAFETSWDYQRHPLIPAPGKYNILISDMFYSAWSIECDERFETLKMNEEELNRIFAEVYSMQDEVPIEVSDDKVSVRKADLTRDIKSLISYAVGCIMGRYSTEKDGLILADQGSTVADYEAKVPNVTMVLDTHDDHDVPIDYDGILPILDGEWFSDDLVTEIKLWLSQIYGEDVLTQNVTFIEEALGKDLRSYLVKDFYVDHIKIYQKRPIYWLVSSPKKSFSCLIYMHRYNESTMGQVLTSYLRPYIEKLNGAISALETSDRASDRTLADKYRTIVEELTDWERNVMHPLAQQRVSIDLDDGVKVNYNKFPHALRKVPGLSEWN